MKINRKLLPIKAHFFFFMCAMGPILPQLAVYGKELGISTTVMGVIQGILPLAFLMAKPLFGILVDIYRNDRKIIFMLLIVAMTTSYALMIFIPAIQRLNFVIVEFNYDNLQICNVSVIRKANECNNDVVTVLCTSSCFQQRFNVLSTDNEEQNLTSYTRIINRNNTYNQLCSLDKIMNTNYNRSYKTCDLKCHEDVENDHNDCLYKTLTFWSFVILISIGTIGFNVVNSISDAICCDVVGTQHDYGKQRVWGTIGFGVTALISGYIVDLFSVTTISYLPAFIIMLISFVFDIIACWKLKLPIIESPKNIVKDLRKLISNKHVITFIAYAVFAGIIDSFIIYFLFWYIEDLAKTTETPNIKLIEGVIVAAETLGAEVLFFSISGKIIQRFGHVHCFSMCFINYSLRLALISIAPNPWWILPIEFLLQGPTYALTYTTIVEFANKLSPPGTSATMQGIAAGMDDGVGYAIGSIIGGLLYKYIGGKQTMQVFSAFALICSVTHLVLHKAVLHDYELPVSENCKGNEYDSPEGALKKIYDVTNE